MELCRVLKALNSTNQICGRVDEVRKLEELLSSRKPEFLAVYGRRRVGKTFLIRRFFGPRTTFFELTGRAEGTRSAHLQLFHDALAETFGVDRGRTLPSSWGQAFRQLVEALNKHRRSRKRIVLFFDELPWLATRRSDCLQELEYFWNRHASEDPRVILVVCGSAAAWMIQKIVRARGGLHNRLTSTIRLMPFSLVEARAYVHQRGLKSTNDEIVELYMALGGVPYYLNLVRGSESVAQNIDRLCFEPSGPLRYEFEDVFRSLFDDGDQHRRTVETLARHPGGLAHKDLVAKARVPAGGTASRVVAALEEAGFITIDVPFGRHSRDRRVRLTDEFSLFALRWMKGARRRSWVQLRGSPGWRTWAGLAFESLCLQHAYAIEHALGISGVSTEASPWTAQGDGGAQIDLLFDRADNVISICELKFTEAPFVITKPYASSLQNKLDVFRMTTRTRKALRLVLVTARGLKRNKWSDQLVDSVVTLEDLFI